MRETSVSRVLCVCVCVCVCVLACMGGGGDFRVWTYVCVCVCIYNIHLNNSHIHIHIHTHTHTHTYTAADKCLGVRWKEGAWRATAGAYTDPADNQRKFVMHDKAFPTKWVRIYMSVCV
jgi:hypothetical protein